MATVTATLIDYGASNLHSVKKALEKAGFNVEVASHPNEISENTAFVLPGQGHFGQVMQQFLASGFETSIREHIAQKRPFLGICVGLQLLMDSSEEAENIKGLGIIKGNTKRFPEGSDSVPQMGWNQIKQYKNPSLLQNVSKDAFVYFANSYYVSFDEDLEGATTTYAGLEFKSAVSSGPLNAVQFHPEKSQTVGQTILKNFRELSEHYLSNT